MDFKDQSLESNQVRNQVRLCCFCQRSCPRGAYILARYMGLKYLHSKGKTMWGLGFWNGLGRIRLEI